MSSNAQKSLTSFELQSFQAGNWKIDSIYDDKELAIDMAKRLLGARRATAMRVVEERFADDGELKSRVVFRQSLVDDTNAEALERKIQVQKEVKEARDSRHGTGRHPLAVAGAGTNTTDGVAWLFVKLIGISAVGLVALFVLSRMIFHG
ncbi:MAG TPA: hypothetical protein VEJ16_04135 [Alphaproteobacteria bacterium]|nr:hypothetical protein [Alphaproteobacteria bacterium]